MKYSSLGYTVLHRCNNFVDHILCLKGTIILKYLLNQRTPRTKSVFVRAS